MNIEHITQDAIRKIERKVTFDIREAVATVIYYRRNPPHHSEQQLACNQAWVNLDAIVAQLDQQLRVTLPRNAA